jgi:hypothetical protein
VSEVEVVQFNGIPEPGPTPPRNIYQRLNAVMQEVAYVRKDKRVEGYMAVTHDMVTAIVRPSFVKHGIVIVPQERDGSRMVDTTRRSDKGNPAFRFEATFKVAFINVDDPSDAALVIVPAHADDFGDKAPGKCLSYAVKSAILKILMLETGEDEEGRIQPEPEPYNEDEEARLTNLRADALNGMGALQTAWKAMPEALRLRLHPQLASLKDAARAADASAKSALGAPSA